MWTEFFYGKLDYTGIDINPKCIMFAIPEMRRIVEIGRPLRCGDRRRFSFTADILTSLCHLWGCLSDKAVYAIEDLHTMTLYKGREGMLVEGRDFYGVLERILRRTSSYISDVKMLENQNYPPTDKFSGHVR